MDNLKKFDYLNNSTIEDLKALKERVLNEYNEDIEKSENKNESSELRSELKNSDIPFNREYLEAIDSYIEIKKNKQFK